MAVFYGEKHTRVGARGNGRGGFTLIELLCVIVIISILASISTTGIRSAREKARQTNCMSNLRQIGVALVTYRGDHSGGNPNWISNLYPTYIDDLSVYVCRSDTAKGRGVIRPNSLAKYEGGTPASKYKETIDNVSARSAGQNSDVEANSYMYEFSNANCSFGTGQSGVSTWAEYKVWEMREGNNGKPFSSSKIPIVRCFHHAAHSSIDQYPEGTGGAANKSGHIMKSGLTLNVAYAGNVTIAPLWWQGAVEIGDKDHD